MFHLFLLVVAGLLLGITVPLTRDVFVKVRSRHFLYLRDTVTGKRKWVRIRAKVRLRSQVPLVALPPNGSSHGAELYAAAEEGLYVLKAHACRGCNQVLLGGSSGGRVLGTPQQALDALRATMPGVAPDMSKVILNCCFPASKSVGRQGGVTWLKPYAEERVSYTLFRGEEMLILS